VVTVSLKALRGIFYIFFNHFCKIIRALEILADLATNRRAPWRLVTTGHEVLRRPTAAGPNRRGPLRVEDNVVDHGG
jgi:hypothetical protein